MSTDSYTCANCGRAINGTICGWCDTEDREPVMTPERTRTNVAKLKMLVLLGTLALLALPDILSRLALLDEAAVKTGLYVVAAVIAVVVLKFFVASSDERL